MMSDRIKKKIIMKIISLVICMILFININDLHVYADEGDENEVEKDPVIVVSLRDSYSSGEGIEPFYGQDADMKDKGKDPDWLAHRSELSWSGRLTVEGMPEGTTLKDYKVKVDLDGNRINYQEGNDFYWYFVASSGAETKHFKRKEQRKTFDRNGFSGKEDLKRQLNIFDIFDDNTVDYVTLTIGGNDVKFTSIISDGVIDSWAKKHVTSYIPTDVPVDLQILLMPAVANNSYFNPDYFDNKLSIIWKKYYKSGGTKDQIRKTYTDIAKAAGKNAKIIVAGYPKLINQNGCDKYPKEYADKINGSVTKFNGELGMIVDECSKKGLNIYFVDVEEEFNGHEAYTDKPWINEIMSLQSEDLDENKFPPISAYSIHPNKDGAEAYARCVQAKINELEKEKEKEPDEQSEEQQGIGDALISDVQEKAEEEIEKQQAKALEWLEKKIEDAVNNFIANNCGGC